MRKNSTDKSITLIMAIVIAVVVLLGGYAVFEKIHEEREEQRVELAKQEEAMRLQTTVEGLAADNGVTVEEYLKEIGLENSGVTAATPRDEFLNMLTIENFAKVNGRDVAEFKKSFGIEKLDNNMNWVEAQKTIKMSKIAEVEYGVSFEEFAMQNQLPAEITADTTYDEAIKILNAMTAAQAE